MAAAAGDGAALPGLDLSLFVNDIKQRIRSEIEGLLALEAEAEAVKQMEARWDPSATGGAADKLRKFIPMPLLRGSRV